MALLLLTLLFVVCCKLASDYLLPRLIPLLERWLWPCAPLEREQRRQLRQLEQERATILMVDEFPRYARKTREIDALRTLLADKAGARKRATSAARLALRAAWQLARPLLQFAFLWWHWRQPVLTLPAAWLAPCPWLLSVPLFEDGVLSLSVWLFVCHVVVGRLLAALLPHATSSVSATASEAVAAVAAATFS